MKADLVCKGGGMKGIALLGAICHLEDEGYEWEKVAGSSAGAIVSSLLAVGYSGKEIKNMLYTIDYKDFTDKNKLQSVPLVGQLVSLFIYKGIYAGDAIENFLREKFLAKGKTKFKDIMLDGESRLKIIATDITRKKILILPDDLQDYHINPLEFDIAKAIRMSLSIPFFYNPVIITDQEKSSYIVDGGIVSNFPIWIFDVESEPRWPTFGLYLSDGPVETTTKCTNLLEYMLDIVETSLSKNETVYLRDKDSVRIIDIPTLGMKTTNFSITQNELNALYESGYISAKTFLSCWNFTDYIAKYRT